MDLLFCTEEELAKITKVEATAVFVGTKVPLLVVNAAREARQLLREDEGSTGRRCSWRSPTLLAQATRLTQDFCISGFVTHRSRLASLLGTLPAGCRLRGPAGQRRSRTRPIVKDSLIGTGGRTSSIREMRNGIAPGLLRFDSGLDEPSVSRSREVGATFHSIVSMRLAQRPPRPSPTAPTFRERKPAMEGDEDYDEQGTSC